MTPRFLTIEALRALCDDWQVRLGLQGYVIDVSIVRASVFGDHDTIGDCDAQRMKRKARIRLLDPQDYDDANARYDDHETVLVHELLHVLMPMHLFDVTCRPEDLRYQLYEQGIDQLSRTLVALTQEAR